MRNQTFIVSDERQNTHGFVILTAGIDYADFAHNPIMYYNHDESRIGVIGRWENIRVEGTKLLMDAVFDERSAVGERVKRQVEDGFLRCASIGISAPEKLIEINGVKTVSKCRLREVSIVDIPANGNAIKLFDKQNNEVYSLADWMEEKYDPLRKTIIAYLGLSDRADDAEILDALEMRQNSPKIPENAVSRAVRLGLIDKADEKVYMMMAQKDIQTFDELIARKEARSKARFEDVFLKAAREGRINATNRGVYEEIARVGGYALSERVISLAPKPVSVFSLMDERGRADGVPPRSEWGLKEYRKYAPEELRDNNELYASLLKREGRIAPLRGDTVDFYRKYHPEYLANHPAEYKKAMEDKREQAKQM